MTINAKRFEYLDKTTNVPISDFISVNDSAIRSIEIPDVQLVTDKIASMFNSAEGLANSGLDSIKDTVKSSLGDLGLGDAELKGMFRESKDLLGIMADVAAMPNKVFDKMLDGMFPGGGLAKSLARDVFKVCSKAGQGFGNMRPLDIGIDCNGNSISGSRGGCSPSGLTGLLNALSGGSFGSGFSDLNALINSAVSIALSSYDANLCGGFSASISGLNGNKTAITRSAVMTLAGLSSTHNVRGSIDVLNNVDPEDVTVQYPNAVKSVVGNPSVSRDYYGSDGLAPFKRQFGTDDRSIPTIHSSIVDSASLLDSNWNRSDDGMLSISKLVDNNNGVLTGNRGFSSTSKYTLNNNALNATTGLNSVNNVGNDSIAALYSTIG